MSTDRPITARFTTALVAGSAAAALAVVLLAGPGNAASHTEAPPSCESVCLHAEAYFGTTIPVSLTAESAQDLAAITDRNGHGGPTTMQFVTTPAGAEVELVAVAGSIAEVRLLDGPAAGRIGFVPAGWVNGS